MPPAKSGTRQKKAPRGAEVVDPVAAPAAGTMVSAFRTMHYRDIAKSVAKALEPTAADLRFDTQLAARNQALLESEQAAQEAQDLDQLATKEDAQSAARFEDLLAKRLREGRSGETEAATLRQTRTLAAQQRELSDKALQAMQEADQQRERLATEAAALMQTEAAASRAALDPIAATLGHIRATGDDIRAATEAAAKQRAELGAQAAADAARLKKTIEGTAAAQRKLMEEIAQAEKARDDESLAMLRAKLTALNGAAQTSRELLTRMDTTLGDMRGQNASLLAGQDSLNQTLAGLPAASPGATSTPAQTGQSAPTFNLADSLADMFAQTPMFGRTGATADAAIDKISHQLGVSAGEPEPEPVAAGEPLKEALKKVVASNSLQKRLAELAQKEVFQYQPSTGRFLSGEDVVPEVFLKTLAAPLKDSTRTMAANPLGRRLLQAVDANSSFLTKMTANQKQNIKDALANPAAQPTGEGLPAKPKRRRPGEPKPPKVPKPRPARAPRDSMKLTLEQRRAIADEVMELAREDAVAARDLLVALRHAKKALRFNEFAELANLVQLEHEQQEAQRIVAGRKKHGALYTRASLAVLRKRLGDKHVDEMLAAV